MSCADEMELLHFIGATGRATVQAMSQGSPPYDVANAARIPMKSERNSSDVEIICQSSCEGQNINRSSSLLSFTRNSLSIKQSYLVKDYSIEL